MTEIDFGDSRLPSRFWSKVLSQDSGCWLWQAARTDGYGIYSINAKAFRAHRIAYESLVGTIPAEMQLDHLCRNRACVNPGHTEPVSQGENIRRGEAGVPSGAQQRAKTHCRKGHPYSEGNTYIRKNGHRTCRTCNAEGQRRMRRRNIGVTPEKVTS
jgi:hypothetical protein